MLLQLTFLYCLHLHTVLQGTESKTALKGTFTLHYVELDSEKGCRLPPGGHLSLGHIATCSPFRLAG